LRQEIPGAEGEVDIIEFDYTFYTDTGEGEIETSEIELPSTATVLTAVHRETGMVNNSVVVRKEIWPYAVARFGKFLTELKRFVSIILRGDSEPALQSFLTALAQRVRKALR